MSRKTNYIIETIKVGNSIKMSAIDPLTGQEASIICPVHGFNKLNAQKIAIRKLEYVIEKKKAEEEQLF